MTSPVSEASSPKGLLARAIGVFFSPRETYADIVARPRVFGALVVVVGIIAATQFAFLSTDIGQQAQLDQQIERMESFGFTVTDQMIEGMERQAPLTRYFAVGGITVFTPLMMAVMAGIGIVVFNALLGGEATFRQVYSIVIHSGFIGALQQLFVMPLNYARESMSSATSLAVFLPMLDDASFLGRLAGSIDFFQIWSLISLAIGLAVLYRKRTAPIAWSLLAVYAIIVLGIASVQVIRSGA
jgi:hypothetical protein